MVHLSRRPPVQQASASAESHKKKQFAYMEYHRSPQDNALRRELWTLSTKILLDKAQSRLDSASKVHTNKDVLDHVFLSIRYGDTDSLPSRTRRNSQDNTIQAIPVTLDDITLQVGYKQGDEIEEDVSCDSGFMLGVMDRVGEALRKAFYWVRQNEWIYLVMDNAGGHGTAEAWETFTNSLTTKYKVKKIRQCPRSPETNVLDLGIWLSIQAAVEKRMHLRRGDKEALANATTEAWKYHLSVESFTRVCDRLRNVLALIAEDNGGNALVEEKRGKAFRGLDLPVQEQLEEDDEEEE
jgi:hypothetical protein